MYEFRVDVTDSLGFSSSASQVRVPWWTCFYREAGAPVCSLCVALLAE